MNQHPGRRKAGLLWGLIAVAMSYIALLSFLPALTGKPLLDGTIGVVLGLYICSRPAANAVDMLFFERHALRQLKGAWSGIGWLALNLLALGAGWLVLERGVLRLVAH
jgi:hypothetical protein